MRLLTTGLILILAGVLAAQDAPKKKKNVRPPFKGGNKLPANAPKAVRHATFKSREELADLYSSRGISGERPVIAYCRIGERSSHTWFVLKYLLGLDGVTNYDGSWTEYGNLVGVDVERGEG